MKIILSVDPIKYPLTGIGRYTYELAKQLTISPEIKELLFLQGRRLSSKLPIITEAVNTFDTSHRLRRLVQRIPFSTEIYRMSAPWLKTYALRKHSDAIYHGPNFYLPPRIDRCVATFHDLSIFTWPQCHPADRVQFMQKELLQTIKRANILITDSDFTRKELAAYFNFPLSKIFTAQLASSGEFYPRDIADISNVVNKFGLKPNQYCLFTGSIEPRKNIETLLNAYERLPKELRLTCPLVISGFKGWGSQALHQRFQQAQAAGWLRYLGYTSAADLPFLFAGARSFLFPSLYEGFGLPVLEALASGVPVVCSDSSSLPEVVGDCGLMCRPLDVESLTLLIQKSIEDKIWREQAILNGLNRAKNFSWQRCAQETIHAYHQV